MPRFRRLDQLDDVSRRLQIASVPVVRARRPARGRCVDIGVAPLQESTLFNTVDVRFFLGSGHRALRIKFFGRAIRLEKTHRPGRDSGRGTKELWLAHCPVTEARRRARRFWNDEASSARAPRNIGHLLTGNLFGPSSGTAGFVVTARALGPTDYGVLALIYSYTRAVERLISFQSGSL